jgi:hypothetical protein
VPISRRSLRLADLALQTVHKSVESGPAASCDREAARRALVSALDNWDRDAADEAIVRYAPG